MNYRFGNFSLSSFRPTRTAPATSSETKRVGREHFIPVRPVELVNRLASDEHLSKEDRSRFRKFAGQLETTIHNECRLRLQRLQDVYAYVNPDADTDSLSTPGNAERQVATDDLFFDFAELLRRANFRQLTEAEIRAAIGCASTLGVRLDIDLNQFEHLSVFARGEAVVTATRSAWTNWWYRIVEIEVPMYQRLVVLFRIRENEESTQERVAYLRLFKNVPHQDIDMLLPGGKIHMSMLDRGKILLPTISGIGLATFKLGLLLVAGIYGLFKIGLLLFGAIGSGWKSVNGYWKTRNRYELNLTRNLYYQNLDNNAGVLLRVAGEAEAQELRETLLAYFVMLKSGESQTEEELDEKVERLLSELGLEVDFEVDDALSKIARLKLGQADADQCWSVVPLEEAAQVMMSRNLRMALDS